MSVTVPLPTASIVNSDSTKKKKKRKRNKGDKTGIGLNLNQQYKKIDILSPFDYVATTTNTTTSTSTSTNTDSVVSIPQDMKNETDVVGDGGGDEYSGKRNTTNATVPTTVDMNKILNCPQITLFPIAVEVPYY